jgi:hypothetical protein
MEVSGQLYPQGKSPGTHWIGGWVSPRAVLDAVSEFIQVGDETLLFEIHTLIDYTWNCQSGGGYLLIVPVDRKDNKADCINY